MWRFAHETRPNKTNFLFPSAINCLSSKSIPVRIAIPCSNSPPSSTHPLTIAHSRVYASNESRGSVAGWAPSAALRPATDAEIASRVSGVSGAYVASVSSSPAPPASPPDDDDLDSGPTQYSNGVSQLKFPSAETLPTSLPDVVRPIARATSATRINRVMEAAEQQYGMRPRGTVGGATFVDPYANVPSDIVENMDRVAASQQREGVATGYGMQRPPSAPAAAAAPMPPMQPPHQEGVARGYSSGVGVPTGYTRPIGNPQQQNLRAQQHGAPTEQYGQLQLIPREDEQAAADQTALFY